MADTDTPSPQSGGDDADGSRCRRRGGNLKIALAAVIGAAVTLGSFGIVKTVVGAHWDDDDLTGFVEHRLDHVLDRLDATDAQRDQIIPVIADASRELEGLYRDIRASRRAFVDALTGDAVDRDALETLRGERIAALDAASRATVGALAEAVELLTPDQRQQLSKRLQRLEWDDD